MLFHCYKGFSRGAARTLHTAVLLAGRQGCTAADTGHLLLAMLQTAQGPAADFLRRKRVTETALDSCARTRSCSGQPHSLHKNDLAPEMRKTMEFAVLGAHAASVARAEKYILTPEAGEDSPGVLRCYDPELAVQVIEEASSQCDYLVVYVHWGTEYSTQLEQAQTDLATLFAEAGADLIVGSHPHILQGAGWRGDVPVLYSLGNFWFNMETVDTALLTVTLTGPGAENATVRLIPCIQTGGRTSILTDKGEKARILDHLNSISESGWFDADGVLHPPEEQP